jgi:hypothetical protein
MGLPLFGPDHNSEAKEMQKRLNSALGKDRKAAKKAGPSSTIYAVLKGDATKQVKSLHAKEVLRWIEIIRQRFHGIVIHRTVLSVDNLGRRISGLEPFHEHYLVVKLYEHEYAHLELMADKMVSGTDDGGPKLAVSVSTPLS